MNNCITLPPQWTTPKFSFLQRVKFTNERMNGEIVEEFGTVMGFEHQPDSDYSDLKPGWWCHVTLDEDSPGWMPYSSEIRHEDELTLIEQEEVCEPCKH